MFKSIVNAVINTESTAVKVVGYSILAVVGIGADIIGADAKETETKETKVAETPAPTTEEVADEDIVMEVIHDEDTVTEVVNEDPEDPYDDSADREAENELFEAAIKSTSDSFVMACEEAIELRENGNEEEAIETEKMAKLFLDYLHINLGKEDECLMVDNVQKALAAFRAFEPKRIEWM